MKQKATMLKVFPRLPGLKRGLEIDGCTAVAEEIPFVITGAAEFGPTKFTSEFGSPMVFIGPPD
jgi:hypothetical protein